MKQCAREPASFWHEKRDSLRHFSTSLFIYVFVVFFFCENGVVAKTSYRHILSFFDQDCVQLIPVKITVQTQLLTVCQMKLQRVKMLVFVKRQVVKSSTRPRN